jgi:NADH dehydrogenase
VTHIVVIGAGFAGLEVVKRLKDTEFQITLIDRNNFHQFTPLLYQVATAHLEAEEIVFPIRQLLNKNTRFLMATVHEINPYTREVITDVTSLNYDYLVIATGSVTNYFGVVEADVHSYPLKTLQDGIRLRNHILTLIERASYATVEEREELLSFAIVGGGPTGVEFAGALAELLKGPISKDHPNIQPDDFKVHLVDANDNVLKVFRDKLSGYARERLEKMGVTIHSGRYVTELSRNRVYLSSGEEIKARTTIWSAGIVGPDYLTGWELPLDDRNFITVDHHLKVIGFENIFAIGDIASIDSHPLPKMATIAVQQGQYIAKYLSGDTTEPFQYRDKGKMAVIGRNAAIVEMGRVRLTGMLAWMIWSIVHIYKLIGMRNRLNIMINWVVAYFRKGGQTRVILPGSEDRILPMMELGK